MKIAFVPSTFLPWIGGAEIQTHNMANKIIELGNSVDIFLLKKKKINNRKYKIVKLNNIVINLIFIVKYYFSIDLTFLLKIWKSCDCNQYVFHVAQSSALLIIYAMNLSSGKSS